MRTLANWVLWRSRARLKDGWRLVSRLAGDPGLLMPQGSPRLRPHRRLEGEKAGRESRERKQGEKAGGESRG